MAEFNVNRANDSIVNATRIVIGNQVLPYVKTELYKGKITIVERDKELYKSKMLGANVYSDLDIEEFTYTDNYGKIIRIPHLTFENVLFNIVQRKNVITTPVAGRNGTVKEFISDGDYLVQIKGAITTLNGKYPLGAELNDVGNLLKLLKAPVSFNVNSWFLTMFDIYSLVCTYFEVPQLPGSYSTQDFSLDCLSDTPFEININA